jgi:hypothetical protein
MMDVLRREDERWMQAMKEAFKRPIDWGKYYRKRDKRREARVSAQPVDAEKACRERAEQFNLFPQSSTDEKISSELAAATLSDTDYFTSQ